MLNACIVGYGAIGPIHARAIEECDNARLYAVCDNSPQKTEKCFEEYKPVCTYNDFDEMLKDKNIDVVHVCTPHYLHAQMTEKAINAGKYVVLEKPVSINQKELHRLLALNSGDRICVMLQNRTNRCVQKLKDIISNDTSIGELLASCAFITWSRTKEYYLQDSWRGKWATEGGALMINQAVHTLDLLVWLSGGVKSIKASISTKALNDVIETEDTADALLKLKNGRNALFYGSNAYSGFAPVRIEFTFEKAVFRYADERLYKIDENGVEVIENDNTHAPGKHDWGGGHVTVINDFYNHILDNNKEFISLTDAAHTMEVLFSLYESAKNNSQEIIIG